MTVEVHSHDGGDVDPIEVREALEAAGYKVRTWVLGRQVLARETVAIARERLKSALLLLEDSDLFRSDSESKADG